MVCKNEQNHAAICWDNKTMYGFVVEPTEYERRLVGAVNKLPAICRKTVILFAFEGVAREEIASILHTSVTAVRFFIESSGLLLRRNLADEIKQNSRNFTLNGIFANWPWMEYAELVKLRKNLVFLK
jgi:DNA-directed RNA polymerase specialized sigma24 family protein